MKARIGRVCNYLRGSTEGARCDVMKALVRTLEDADIRMCMSNHHEACSYYRLSLRAPGVRVAPVHDKRVKV